LLADIIDNAILFSNARRGFILLKEGEKYSVKIARNLAGENISLMTQELSQSRRFRGGRWCEFSWTKILNRRTNMDHVPETN
jgi:hypothetical protein